MRLGEWQQGLAGNKESPPQSKNSMAGMFYNDKTRQWEFGEEFIEVVNLLADLYDDGVALYNTMDIEIGYTGNAANAEEKTALTTERYESLRCSARGLRVQGNRSRTYYTPTPQSATVLRRSGRGYCYISYSFFTLYLPRNSS